MLLKVFPTRVHSARLQLNKQRPRSEARLPSQGHARIVAATAASQIEFLDALTQAPRIDWSKVEAFHLDEYIGLPVTHPGSFRKMLLEQLIQKTGISRYHLLDGDALDPAAIARRVSKELASSPVDIEFLGIGENGHLAFNDPPANFEVEDPYIVVELDEACRRQQVGEAWFADISQVPRRALSMSVRQVLKAKEILAVVPDQRKAQAIHACFAGEISSMAPASILRTHPNATVYLDKNSASMLPGNLREVGEHELSSAVRNAVAGQTGDWIVKKFLTTMLLVSGFTLQMFAQSGNDSSAPQIGTVRVDTNPDHVINSFDPDSALGSSIDALSRYDINKVFTPHIIQESLSAGWGPLTTAITPSCAWPRGIGTRTAPGVTPRTRADISPAAQN